MSEISPLWFLLTVGLCCTAVAVYQGVEGLRRRRR